MEETKGYSESIKYTGIFNFAEFYSFLYNWFTNEQYRIVENKYEEKIIGDSKKIDISWGCDRKISDYFMLRIKVKLDIDKLRKIQVKEENEKKITNTGSISIKFSGVIFNDYQNSWEGYPLLKFLRDFYDRYFINSRIESYKKKLKEDIEEISSLTKSFLRING